MKSVISYSQLCKNLKATMDDEAVDPKETAYLLRSPKNAKHLLKSLAASYAGQVEAKTLNNPKKGE